jgi:endonuclease YncB( thermonuclease family)
VIRSALVAALLFALPTVPGANAVTAHAVITGPARVIDGDTLVVAGTHVRIAYIDAPETHQTCLGATGAQVVCGKLAAQAMADLIHGNEVTCNAISTDRYGRSVAVCGTPAQADLGREMVARGWAVDFRKYDRHCTYCADEKAAHDAGVGVWADKFEMPWDWRAEHSAHRLVKLKE